MKSIKISPLVKSVNSSITIPGSKSYTNRALILASLTDSPVRILNPLISDDTTAMTNCLKTLGIKINKSAELIEVIGSIKDIKPGLYNLNADLSANTIRFILPLLTITPGTKILKGKVGLNKRPIKELVDALVSLGADIEYLEKKNYPPLKIRYRELKPKNISMNGQTSSQYLSAILMIMPLLGNFKINVISEQISKPYIDITIDIMKKFGVDVLNNNYKFYTIKGNQNLSNYEYEVEGDYSSASYFFAIAALTKSTVTIENLNPNSVQADKKILDILEKMGNKIIYGDNSVTIIGKSIRPINVDMTDFPDQAQTLAVLCSFAKGESRLSGLQSLHIKETDRLSATEDGLNKMKIKTQSTKDTLKIFGRNPVGSAIDTFGDQRTAMSFAIAGSKIPGMEIKDPDVVTKTFPEFWEKIEGVGIKIERKNN